MIFSWKDKRIIKEDNRKRALDFLNNKIIVKKLKTSLKAEHPRGADSAAGMQFASLQVSLAPQLRKLHATLASRLTRTLDLQIFKLFCEL